MKIKNFGKLALMAPMVTVVFAEEPVQVLDDVAVIEQTSKISSWLTEDSSTKPIQDRTELGRLTKVTPLAGSIVDQQELNTVKYIDLLRDQLSRIPGVSIVRNMRIPDGGKSYTMGMLDGIILGSPLNQNTTVIDRVNQQEIESIEVVRGPNSVLYPSNGIAGTLNVITKEPSKTPIYSLSQEFGSHDFFRTQGSTSGTIKSAINDIGYSVGFNFMENNPWKDRNKSEKGSASGKLVFHPDIDSTLTLRLEHAQTYEEGPGGLTQQQFDSNWQQASPTLKNAYQDFEFITGLASYKRKIGEKGQLEMTFSRHEQNGKNSNSGGGATNSSEQFVDNAENIAHTFYRHDFDTFKSRVYTGLDIIEGYQNTDTWNRITNTFVITDKASGTVYNEFQLSPFIQYEFSPLDSVFAKNSLLSSLDNLRFNFGLLNENYQKDYQQTYIKGGGSLKSGNSEYERLIKKGGLSYEYSKDHVLWFGMADGWLVPGASTNATATYPNYAVTPESSVTKQLGLRGYFRDAKLSYDVAAYETNIDNYIANVLCSDNPAACPGWAALRPSQTKTAASFSSNPGSVTARGFETSLAYQPHELVKFGVAHTLTFNKWDEYNSGATKLQGVTSAISPKHHVNGRITLYPVPKWSIEFESDYISRYYTNVQNTDTYQRPMLFNLRSSYTWKDLTFTVQAMNLLNTKYASRVSADAANVKNYQTLAGTGDGPFSFRAGIQYQF